MESREILERAKLESMKDSSVDALIAQKLFGKVVYNDVSGLYVVMSDKTTVDLPNYCNGEHIDNVIAKLMDEGLEVSLQVDGTGVECSVSNPNNDEPIGTFSYWPPIQVNAGRIGIIRLFCESILESLGVDNAEAVDVFAVIPERTGFKPTAQDSVAGTED